MYLQIEQFWEKSDGCIHFMHDLRWRTEKGIGEEQFEGPKLGSLDRAQ